MGTGKLEKFRVSGHSMYPLLQDGQEVEAEPINEYKIGDVVVAQHPFQRDLIVIKQITAIRDQNFRLQGVNREESSDNFGYLPLEDIIGKVILT